MQALARQLARPEAARLAAAARRLAALLAARRRARGLAMQLGHGCQGGLDGLVDGQEGLAAAPVALEQKLLGQLVGHRADHLLHLRGMRRGGGRWGD